MIRKLSHIEVNDLLYDTMSMSVADLCREIFDRGYAQAELDAATKHYTENDIDAAFYEGRKSVYVSRSPAAYLINYKLGFENDNDN